MRFIMANQSMAFKALCLILKLKLLWRGLFNPLVVKYRNSDNTIDYSKFWYRESNHQTMSEIIIKAILFLKRMTYGHAR